MSKTPAQVLREAAEEVRTTDVWENRKHCADTLIVQCTSPRGPRGLTTDFRTANSARQFLLRHLGLEGDETEIWKWNDEKGRTKDEVIAALLAAAFRAESTALPEPQESA